jgi:hypothetical protein
MESNWKVRKQNLARKQSKIIKNVINWRLTFWYFWAEIKKYNPWPWFTIYRIIVIETNWHLIIEFIGFMELNTRAIEHQ